MFNLLPDLYHKTPEICAFVRNHLYVDYFDTRGVNTGFIL